MTCGCVAGISIPSRVDCDYPAMEPSLGLHGSQACSVDWDFWFDGVHAPLWSFSDVLGSRCEVSLLHYLLFTSWSPPGSLPQPMPLGTVGRKRW